MTAHNSKLKVLVIRFNAIGDLVLLTPTVRALAENGYEVHFLVKKAFSSMLDVNPYVQKVWTLDDKLSPVIKLLKEEAFDLIVDLHNNLRSKKVAAALGVTRHTLHKDRIGLWLLTTFGINRIKEEHIVHRFLKVIEPLGISVSEPKTEFYLKPSPLSKLLPAKYLAIAIGAAWATKEIPIDKLVFLIDNCQWEKIILLGGPNDEEKAQAICSKISKSVHNLVGQISISESALVVKQASVLLTGDTGMMHIAAALETPIVAVFGSTHPILGFTPFTSSEQYTLIENTNLGCRPCTKQGKSSCPKGHFKCILDLDYAEVVYKLDHYI